jgi:hypothetical protein
MTMHILPGGRVGIGKSIFLPEADRNEMIEFPVWSVLLRHALANVLFDSGCHPAVADNAEARWGGLAKFMTPVMGSHDKVIAAPSGLGLGPRGHRRRRQFAPDAVSLRASLDRHVAPRDTWNADALLRAFDEIRRLESGGATVLCGHLQQWATLRTGAQRL